MEPVVLKWTLTFWIIPSPQRHISHHQLCRRHQGTWEVLLDLCMCVSICSYWHRQKDRKALRLQEDVAFCHSFSFEAIPYRSTLQNTDIYLQRMSHAHTFPHTVHCEHKCTAILQIQGLKPSVWLQINCMWLFCVCIRADVCWYSLMRKRGEFFGRVLSRKTVQSCGICFFFFPMSLLSACAPPMTSISSVSDRDTLSVLRSYTYMESTEKE